MRTLHWYILGGLMILASTGSFVYAERGEYIDLALFVALVGVGLMCFVMVIRIGTGLARRWWR